MAEKKGAETVAPPPRTQVSSVPGASSTLYGAIYWEKGGSDCDKHGDVVDNAIRRVNSLRMKDTKRVGSIFRNNRAVSKDKDEAEDRGVEENKCRD